MARDLAGRGHVVLLVHYFDSTGDRFAHWGMNPLSFLTWMQTVGAAVGYAERRPNVGAGHIGLVGVSLGAYLALSVAAQDPRVGAVVECFGGFPPFFAEALDRMPPVLILHGEDDRIVPVREAHNLERLLRDRNRPYEIQIYPGQGHRLLEAESRDALDRAAAFLDRHLKRSAERSARVSGPRRNRRPL